jgi:hypothetical protein
MSARIIKKEFTPTFGSDVVTVSYQQAESRQLFKYHAGMVRHFVDGCADRDEARRMHTQLSEMVQDLEKLF